jgi:hypothetical protein
MIIKMKKIKVCIIGITKKMRGKKRCQELKAKIFPSLMKMINAKNEEAKNISNRRNINKSTA